MRPVFYCVSIVVVSWVVVMAFDVALRAGCCLGWYL